MDTENPAPAICDHKLLSSVHGIKQNEKNPQCILNHKARFNKFQITGIVQSPLTTAQSYGGGMTASRALTSLGFVLMPLGITPHMTLDLGL